MDMDMGLTGDEPESNDENEDTDMDMENGNQGFHCSTMWPAGFSWWLDRISKAYRRVRLLHKSQETFINSQLTVE